MQIIINRIAIICETQNMVQKLKWGTAIVMTTINIAVFCIVSGFRPQQACLSESPREIPSTSISSEVAVADSDDNQFIPAHRVPPVSSTYVEINMYWDRISKVFICLIDAGLNYYFLRIVKQRLLNQYGLMKYSPLVAFNARLMFISVLLDVSICYPYSTLPEIVKAHACNPRSC